MGAILTVNDFLAIITPISPSIEESYRNRILPVLEAYSNGVPLIAALRDNDMSYTQFRYILSRNPQFAANMKNITSLHRSAFEEKHVNNIDEASEKDWKASKWLLQIADPEKYGDKIEIKNVHDDVPACVADYIPADLRENATDATFVTLT